MTFRLTRIAAILTVTMLGAAYAQPSPPDIPKSVDSVLSNEKFRKAMAHIGSEHERIVGPRLPSSPRFRPHRSRRPRAPTLSSRCCGQAASGTPSSMRKATL